MTTNSKLRATWLSAGYKDQRNWDARHPVANKGLNLGINDYRGIAHRGVEDIRAQAHRFLEDNDVSFVEIPHASFQERYEHRSINFREWFKQECRDNGLNQNADVVLIGPSVKDEASCARKMEDEKNEPDAILDYLRLMLVVLKSRHSPKARLTHKHSFDVLDRLILAVEGDISQIPYKNQLWDPHKETGYRGYKTRSIATDAEDPKTRIACEVKTQHEAQMDVDKLTRYLLTIQRESLRMQKQFRGATGKRGAIDSEKAEKRVNFAKELGRMFYDRVHADSGFDQRYLNPEIAENQKAPSFWNIEVFVNSHLELFNPQQQRTLISKLSNSGLFPKSSEFFSAPGVER